MPDHQAHIRSLIEGVDALRGTQPVRRLNGGEVSTTWLVRGHEQAFVVRMDHPLAQTLGLNRQSETDVLRVVGAAGIGPELVWSDPDRGIQVCTYLPGHSWTKADMHNPAQLTELARTLARLHQLPCAGRKFSANQAAHLYADEVATDEARELESRIEQLAEELESAISRKALCHNDLVHGNLVGRKPVQLIDWEYAAVGDPCFDLAIVIRHHELSESLADVFLDEYARKAPAIRRDRLEQFYLLYDLLAFLWYQTMIKRCGSTRPFQAELDSLQFRLKEFAPNHDSASKT
jgi:thiamine kinase